MEIHYSESENISLLFLCRLKISLKIQGVSVLIPKSVTTKSAKQILFEHHFIAWSVGIRQELVYKYYCFEML